VNWRVKFYKTEGGRVPVKEWIDSLRNKKFIRRIKNRLEKVSLGYLGDCSSVGEGVNELRFFFGSGYRIYFGYDQENVILLLIAGDKDTQNKDIKNAKEIWQKYKERKYG